MQTDVPVFVNHITLRVPVLILTITKDFNKLFENSSLTAVAALSKLGRVMVVAVYVSFMFVVAVLSTKDGRTYRAGEMFDVVFTIERGNVGSTKSTSTCMAEQVQSAEIIRFAKRVLVGRLFWDGKEFGSDNFAAVLSIVSSCTEVCD
jgi:hypothetical protein